MRHRNEHCSIIPGSAPKLIFLSSGTHLPKHQSKKKKGNMKKLLSILPSPARRFRADNAVKII